MKLNCKRIDFTYTPGEEIFAFSDESGLPFIFDVEEELTGDPAAMDAVGKMLDEAEKLAEKAKAAIKAALADEDSRYHSVVTFFMEFHRDDVGPDIAASQAQAEPRSHYLAGDCWTSCASSVPTGDEMERRQARAAFSDLLKEEYLEIAVFRNDVPMIHFLLEHGADPGLAEEQPLLLTAARCCGPEVVALFAGQAAKLSSKQKERAFQEVRWGKRPENIQVLEQAGITVDKFGGEAFRAAVSDGNTKLARLLLEKGADINYHKPDMVFPNASTAVTEAVRHKNLPMVRWLIEQGADITIADKYGDRPYTVAVQNKNQELADYLKALEPEEWHNEQEKLRQLMPYKLPAKLVEYLKTGPLRLEFSEQKWVKWAELYSFMDVQEMTWKRKKLLSLMAAMDNYSDYLLLWSPRDKKLWYLDIEHEEFHPLSKWDDFITDPGRYLNGMIEGEFEE